jgi:hypothetical protein
MDKMRQIEIEKCDLLIQVKGLIEVTTWAGLTVAE